jgi:hypothetical protein
MLTDKKTRKTVLYNAEIDTISKNKNGTNIRGFISEIVPKRS